MKRSIVPFIVLLLATSAVLPSAADETEAKEIVISSVTIVGNFKYPVGFLASNLPFREGDRFESREDLDAAIRFLQARFKGALNYFDVEVLCDDSVPEYVDLYVSLIESPADTIKTEYDFTSFPNVPLYGLTGGFSIGPTDQILAVSPAGKGLHRVAFSFGNHFYENNDLALSAGIDLRSTITPELSAGAGIGWLYRAFDGFSASGNDAYATFNLLLDCTWLKSLYSAGFSSELDVRQGVWENVYTTETLESVVSVRGPAGLEILFRNTVADSQGALPEYRLFGLSGGAGVRGPVRVSRGTKMIAFSAEPRFPRLVSVDLGAFFLYFGLSAFADAGKIVPEYRDFLSGGYEAAYGGGLVVSLSSPVSLSLSFEYGWNVELNAGRFFFAVGRLR